MAGRPRKQLPMSDEEILREFRLAKDPKKQLKILADENACSVSTIRSIVFADQLGGFVPIQELAEKEAEKEKNMIVIDPAPTTPTAEPEWPPLPSAPPQAAEDFDDLGPSSLPDVQDIPEASAAPRPYSPESGAAPQAAPLEHSGETSSSGRVVSPRPENGGTSAEAGDIGYLYRISGKDLSRMWHVLGRLQGVLEASAEAGRPGEVMKDACDELEVLLGGIQADMI